MTSAADARPRWRSPIRWIRDLAHHLRTEHASPGRLAAAVAVGLFVGTLPVYGFHFPVCLGLALAFRLNKATTYLAANVSNPLFLPFLVFGAVQLGTLTLEGKWLPLGIEELEAVGPGRFLEAWILGSVELGTILAAVGAVLTLRIARGRKDPWRLRAAGIARRYRRAARWAERFVAGKLRRDPVCKWIAENAGEVERVLDVGCGLGQLSVMLALQGASEVVGVDPDAARVELGRRAAAGLPVRLSTGDALSERLPDADLVLLVDVLHYLGTVDRDALLERAAAAVRPAGRIWVRETVTGRGLRSVLGIASERILAAVGWRRAKTLCFPREEDLVRGLERAGLSCSTRPMWKGTPFANVLVEGRRPAALATVHDRE